MILLKSQKELVNSTENTIIVGWYGSGKTTALIQKALLSNTNSTIITIPELILLTYGLISNMSQNFNNTIHVISYDMINQLKYQDLILLDNFDIIPYKEADVIYNHISPLTNQLIISCSPYSDTPLEENYCYKLSKQLKQIKMKLPDNQHLPEYFLSKLQEIYKPILFKNLINGNFRENA